MCRTVTKSDTLDGDVVDYDTEIYDGNDDHMMERWMTRWTAMLLSVV